MKIRSLFISDVHLGCKYCKAKELFEFIKVYEEDLQHLYIIGDFIDGWKLKRRWYWEDSYNFLIRKIIGLVKKQKTKIHYIAGNHDEFLRDILFHDYGHIFVCDEAIHETVDKKKFLIIHGDQFDVIVKNARFLSIIGDIGYEFMIFLNDLTNKIRKVMKWEPWSFSKTIKHEVKKNVNYVSSFEHHICNYTKKKSCDGVICGHIHTPDLKELEGITYCNTGDWVETCSAIIEHLDGKLELIEL